MKISKAHQNRIHAIEFRRDQMGWNKQEMAAQLGIWASHYSEFISGNRELSITAVRKAFALGVPAITLLAIG